ncbi:MAG TPA: hypothetical protein PK402_04095, partial [Tepidisphaeraceae bacterium]|nr:hypothetical protein [Tepidisphaeraceae bacterium]
MIRFGCALVILIVIGIPILALKYLPTWGALLVISAEVLLLIVGGPKLIGWGIKRMAMRMFSVKSRVLRGATVVVHEVT